MLIKTTYILLHPIYLSKFTEQRLYYKVFIKFKIDETKLVSYKTKFSNITEYHLVTLNNKYTKYQLRYNWSIGNSKNFTKLSQVSQHMLSYKDIFKN